MVSSSPVENKPTKEEDIYVTGISGCFPNSDSIQELADNLFNKEDLVTEDERRWRQTNPEIPQRIGKVNNIRKFDAEFFGLSYEETHCMDPLARISLEKVYECIIDAGFNPSELRNTKTGVFVGISIMESERAWFFDNIDSNVTGSKGCARSMVGNRISNWLGLKGPSYSVDTACSSSLFALDHAYKSIRDGHCDAAIVVGANACLHPHVSWIFAKMGVLSKDGRCKTFDSRANGYVRSESIVACFLQKSKVSRRVHASLIHTKTNCDGYKLEGITYPAGQIQKELLSSFYKECGVPPSKIEYVEAHGTGTKVGDPEELSAIDEIFCEGRNKPLPIGSVKSNLGHSEASSGLNSLAKAIIAYNTGYIAPNINLKTLRDDIPSLIEGRLRVVTEKQKWDRGLLALSSFGFGGANAHILLENFTKPKVNQGLPKDKIPRLICVSGRTESAVKRILDNLGSRHVDADEVRLWHSIHEYNIPGHLCRAYILLDSTLMENNTLARGVKNGRNMQKKKTIRIVYSDLQMHWPTIAKQLLKFPVVNSVVKRLFEALKQKELNLFDLFEDLHLQINYSIVGAVAVHIILTDVLKAIGVPCENSISMDIADICYAYANNDVSAEQAILLAYDLNTSFNDMFVNTFVIKVGLEYNLVKNKYIKEKEVEAYDCSSYTTIFGPENNIVDIVTQLELAAVDIEYLGLNSLFYTKYKEGAAGKMHNVIDNILSSHLQYPQDKNTSANDEIVIDIGFDGKCAIKDQEKPDFLSLVQNTHSHDIQLLRTLGDLYIKGHNLTLHKLYPEVSFPVAQGTTFLSPLIEWNHSDDWIVARPDELENIPFGCKKVRIDLNQELNQYLAGHTIDGRVIFPATGYLYLVWESFALMTQRLPMDVSIVFEDVYFHRATNFPKDGLLDFIITIHEGIGTFEVMESDSSIVTGRIYEKRSDCEFYKAKDIDQNEPLCCNEGEHLSKKDIYKEMNIRGYDYKGLFRGIWSSNIEGTHGRLQWENNWVTYLDTLLQVKLIGTDTRSLYVPTRIEKLIIDLPAHNRILSNLDSDKVLLGFSMNINTDVIRSGGVELQGLHCSSISKKPAKGIPVLEKNEFFPYYSDGEIELADLLRSNIQLIHENIQTYKFKCIEQIDNLYESKSLSPLIEEVAEILADLPLVQAELLVVSSEQLSFSHNISVSKTRSGETNAILYIGANIIERSDDLKEAFATLKPGCFILSRENAKPNLDHNAADYQIVTTHRSGSEYFVLLRKKIKSIYTKYIKVTSSDLTFSWIDDVKKVLQDGQKLVLYTENETINGLLGLVNCLRKEPGGEMVQGLLIADPNAPLFDPNLDLYKEHLQKGLAINVLKNGQWGSYRHLLIKDLETIQVSQAYVNTATIGDLSSLRWWEAQYSDLTSKSNDLTIVHVYCAALNFRDVMTAMGRVTLDAVARGRLAQVCVQGMEVSGRTSNGSRVMGICEKGISNLVEMDKSLMWPIPDEWTFEEAATVPVAYGTVYMALVMIGKIARGESILIHAGSGGVGQAAINVALHHGLQVFTTVGTPAKRDFIKKLFPQLQDSHIGNSRDTSFENMIRRETNGAGVHLVLNSLADEKLQASAKCLRRGGRFLEIGKYDITINTKLAMCFYENEISFHGIMLDYISDESSIKLRKKLGELVMEGMLTGAVRPLTYCEFEKYDVETAYRYMAAGKHIGKIIIKIRDEENTTIAKPVANLIEARPRYTCHSNEVYVLVGGLGGFGLELADWLVLRGARQIVFSSRRGISNGYQSLRIKIWKSYNVNVQICTQDVTTEAGCKKMLEMASAMGPVAAIFNLAVVLNDAVFQNQTPETFANSYGPKAAATLLLDKYSRTLCPKLRDFVIFSSVSCGRGNAGQTNYGFSNSIMERVCEDRADNGLPALAIQWGAIGDVGLVADMQEENIQIEIGGTLLQRISSCLQVLDVFMKQKSAIVSSIVVAEKRASNSGANSIVDIIAQILGITDMKSVSLQVPLTEMGMDSVMAVEIKQTLERDYEIFLTAQEIRLLTFAKLSEIKNKDETEDTLRSHPANALANNDQTALNNGLEMFLRNLGSEKTAHEPYLFLDSLISKNETPDTRNSVIFMMPGIEGCASTLEVLSSKINARVCALQHGLNYEDTLDDIVNRQYETIKSILQPEDKHFVIIGYSFGSIPTLKVAAKLESAGLIGTVICIDGSPKYTSALSKEVCNNTSDFELQNNIICHSFNKLSPNYMPTEELMKNMATIDSFEDRINYAIEKNPVKLANSNQFLHAMARSNYSRLKILLSLTDNETHIIESPITLIRVQTVPFGIKFDSTYELNKWTMNSVEVHCIDANHSNIVDSDDCAAIINDVIKNYKNGSVGLRVKSATNWRGEN